MAKDAVSPPVVIGPARYEIRIKGRVGDAVINSFEGMDAEIEPVETVLHGPVEGRAGLRRLLDRVQDLGLELVEVRRLSR
jgi:hypothetical protein